EALPERGIDATQNVAFHSAPPLFVCRRPELDVRAPGVGDVDRLDERDGDLDHAGEFTLGDQVGQDVFHVAQAGVAVGVHVRSVEVLDAPRLVEPLHTTSATNRNVNLELADVVQHVGAAVGAVEIDRLDHDVILRHFDVGHLRDA